MFRTELIPKPSPEKISLADDLMSIGSCFAVNIGQKLRENKFRIDVNPFGTLFNPHSIFKLLKLSMDSGSISDEWIVNHQGVYHHYDFHGDFSALSQAELLERAERLIHETHAKVQSLSFLIVTFGTAIVYEWKENGQIVANCHKIPAFKFNRRQMDVVEIYREFHGFYEQLKRLNPKVRIILTVSPVRHMKESFEQNNLSKSILRVACDQISRSFPGISYFPAFEIMMDDLRDYRFYAEDMLHPNAVATDYIWQKFAETYFDAETALFIRAWGEVQKALQHRPFHPSSMEHQQFILKTIERVKEFSIVVNVENELRQLTAQLI
ncbi:MAG: GSCFA domain-containing protein [Cyclobacteriaceae bacterium]|nr:GSCFA domain-containing protein [Cyclobacteriaceae bacterium]